MLARADWDADAVRDDLLGYEAVHLGAPDGVLVVDETGSLKKWAKSCGVDEYEVRSWTGWHRPVTLSLRALAAVIRSRLPPPRRKKGARG